MGKSKKQRQKHREHHQSHRSVQKKKRANEKPSTRSPGLARRPIKEKRDVRTKDNRTSGATKQESRICYLCGREISPKQQVDYTCPKCGNHACSLCIEIMDSLGGVCVTCESRATKRKAIWDTIAFVGIIAVIILVLCLILIYHFPKPTEAIYDDGRF